MRFVLDTSAAVKLYAPEEGGSAVLDLLESGAGFIVPDIFPLEFASALLRKERRREVVPGTAQRALRELGVAGFVLVPHAPLLDDAVALASEHQHGLYDCLFLLVARRHDVPVVTFDSAMAALTRRLGISLWKAPA